MWAMAAAAETVDDVETVVVMEKKLKQLQKA